MATGIESEHGEDRWIRDVLRDISELKFCDSYNRMDVVIRLYGTMPPEKWWRLLGYMWPICDNIACHTPWLSSKFRKSSRLRLHMMGRVSRAVYDTLPDVLTVYRGCYENNKFGMSWTLDRDVAAGFPSQHRYYRESQAFLITMIIPKAQCVYLGDDRNEREVVTDAFGAWRVTQRRLVSVEPIEKSKPWASDSENV